MLHESYRRHITTTGLETKVGLTTREFPGATGEGHTLAVERAKIALSSNPDGEFITGPGFVDFTTAMITIHGGAITTDGKLTSTIIEPYPNIAAITFSHSSESHTPEGRAMITIIPIDTRQKTKVYSYGQSCQMGENLNGPQVTVKEEPTIRRRTTPNNTIFTSTPPLDLNQGTPFVLRALLPTHI